MKKKVVSVWAEIDLFRADLFRVEMFLAMHSHPSVEVGDGMWLRCKCRQDCELWSADVNYVAKMVKIPGCLLKEFKTECGKLILGLQPVQLGVNSRRIQDRAD